ncbi:hypothetical protein GCM10020254_87280 [Streptomyces goshikiensis]
MGDAQSCIVYAPLRVGGMLGESLTPQEAAALVVAHLPEGCGPAFERALAPAGQPCRLSRCSAAGPVKLR